MHRLKPILILAFLCIATLSFDTKDFVTLKQDPVTLVFAEFFSPNNDGNNDFFIVKNIEDYPINKIHIFNRWGDKVFQAEPYKNNWDGFSNAENQFFGKQVPDGTYFFRFEYLIGDFKVHRNGKIILMR